MSKDLDMVLNLFYISYPFIKQDYRIYPPGPIHSLVLIYWKYEINKLLQFRMIYNIYICCDLWFSKFIPLEDIIYPG